MDGFLLLGTPLAHLEIGESRMGRIQNQGHDGFMFLLKNFPMSTQSVEAKIKQLADGGNGFTIWYQDENNWVWVWYPDNYGNFVVTEKVDGTFVDTPYPLQYSEKASWVFLRVLDTGSSFVNTDVSTDFITRTL